jgi:hypothetical protein
VDLLLSAAVIAGTTPILVGLFSIYG